MTALAVRRASARGAGAHAGRFWQESAQPLLPLEVEELMIGFEHPERPPRAKGSGASKRLQNTIDTLKGSVDSTDRWRRVRL